jgi:hypothetical protein
MGLWRQSPIARYAHVVRSIKTHDIGCIVDRNEAQTQRQVDSAQTIVCPILFFLCFEGVPVSLPLDDVICERPVSLSPGVHDSLRRRTTNVISVDSRSSLFVCTGLHDALQGRKRGGKGVGKGSGLREGVAGNVPGSPDGKAPRSRLTTCRPGQAEPPQAHPAQASQPSNPFLSPLLAPHRCGQKAFPWR